MDPVLLGLVASAVAAVAAAAALLLGRSAGPALAAGFSSGFLVVAGIPRSPPAETWQWLLPLAIAGGILAPLEGLASGRAPLLRWIPRAALALFAAGVSLLPAHRTVAAVGGAAAGILALGSALEAAATPAGPRSLLAILLPAAGGSAAALGISRSMPLRPPG